MLMNDDPLVPPLTEAHSEPESPVWLLGEAFRRTALEQGPRESDVLSLRDLELDDVKTRARSLPLEEAGPCVSVRPQAAHPVVRGRHIEHDDVIGVASQHGVKIS